MLSRNFEKAFDMISTSFILNAFEKIGCGGCFIGYLTLDDRQSGVAYKMKVTSLNTLK